MQPVDLFDRSLSDLFRMGGAFMWPILMCGLTGTVVALVANLQRAKNLAIAAMAVGLVCIAMGGLAYYLGTLEAKQAIATVSPEWRVPAMARGLQVASIPLKFGVLCSGLPLVLGLVGFVRGRSSDETD